MRHPPTNSSHSSQHQASSASVRCIQYARCMVDGAWCTVHMHLTIQIAIIQIAIIQISIIIATDCCQITSDRATTREIGTRSRLKTRTETERTCYATIARR